MLKDAMRNLRSKETKPKGSRTREPNNRTHQIARCGKNAWANRAWCNTKERRTSYKEVFSNVQIVRGSLKRSQTSPTTTKREEGTPEDSE